MIEIYYRLPYKFSKADYEISEELVIKIVEYAIKHNIKSLHEAINELLEKGLSEL